MTKNQPIVLDFIAKKYQSGELDDDDLVAIIKLIEPYLNPVPLLEFGKENKISYPGILKSKRFRVEEFFKKKYVIDNL